ncbi:hypothetical protein VHUM_02042 [Vanrija humicola]|uniref:Major facilitator superfamily (MFS) profile domain-containing protein n=1 Tax=Vanrija humicola TaxID=5417 RepID=A0A7D8Z081_VANHU|nr:hypothetical protein VHUM_02042 [Vanrija humicola]
MTLLEGLRKYPKACFWSMMISVAVIMEGYDVVLLGNFYAYPAFKKQFGYPTINSKGEPDYEVPARWQAGLGNASGVCSIFGVLLNGILAERFGYRRTMFWTLVWMSGVIFLMFFCKSLGMLLAAQFLAGFAWGIFQTLTTTYAAEVAPLPLRGILTTWVNACWGIGQLIAVGLLRGMVNRTDEWAWRIPYALQWFWPVPLIITAIFAPESPWWLVRKGRVEEARKSLRRLYSGNDEEEIQSTLAMMEHTIAMERATTEGASYLELFKGVNLRRTEIVCGAWAVQQLCGSSFMGYCTYFLQQAGFSVENSFSMTMGQYAINTGGTFIAWGLMGMGIGRRTIYLYGCIWMASVLLIIGGVSLIGTKGSSWAVGVMLLVWSVAYQFTVGTVCYALVAEIPSRRLAIKSINIGRGFYNVIGIVNGSYMAYMLNPTAWNWGGKTAFYWAGMCSLCCVWIFFRLPEPRGLTYQEINARFEAKVPARKFQSVDMNIFERTDENIAAAHLAVEDESKGNTEHVEKA